MPLGGLVIGSLGIIGNAFLIYLVKDYYYSDDYKKNIARRFKIK